MTLRVDIGIFAYNEADGIEAVLRSLEGQDIFQTDQIDVQVHLLANGCQDDTVPRVRAHLQDRSGWVIHDFKQGGKSRTWNRYVHQISRPDADVLVFCDADIRLPRSDSLRELVRMLVETEDLWASVSRPVKDITFDKTPLRPLDRLIASAGGTLTNWKLSICGQLYAMKTDRVRCFHLPIGLPVEDGFVRAMIVTRLLTSAQHFEHIDGSDDVFHVYESERGFAALLRHQTRIVIGAAINSVLFDVLIRSPERDLSETLAHIAQDEQWLPNILRSELPRWPFGYVPFSHLTKRLRFSWQGARLRKKPVLLAGFAFDAIVYLRAQILMVRGTGAGFW